ncbi:hypothetical protein, partial [Phaeobacter italicus]|uniref:hypothetical protein n=1 Tax=Phaeobacter italicus TaxID=481446 RepID=UPI002FDD136E
MLREFIPEHFYLVNPAARATQAPSSFQKYSKTTAQKTKARIIKSGLFQSTGRDGSAVFAAACQHLVHA